LHCGGEGIAARGIHERWPPAFNDWLSITQSTRR
jgi:hypothetical protein